MTNDPMDYQNLMAFLQKNYPHLHDVQLQVERIVADTGFGDVSIILQIANGVVDRGEILGAAKRIYHHRQYNRVTVKPIDKFNGDVRY